MLIHKINPKNTVFVLLSFEGPDKYSLVGGLGIRMTELSAVLAENGYKTHLFFVGDPYAEHESYLAGENLCIHRWCQWLSSEWPGGVYDGEDKKIADWNRTIPEYVASEIVKPSAQKGLLTVIMGEDWHTGESMVLLDKTLRRKNLRDHSIIFWNVNNEYGLWRLNLKEIVQRCTVTTVSKFMVKRLKIFHNINSIAIPNGIPRRIIGEVDTGKKKLLQRCFDGVILQKTARYDTDKAWLPAISAIAILKSRGMKPHLLMRGGSQQHRSDIICKIIELGLRYVTISLKYPSFDSIIEAFHQYGHFDIIEMDFFIPEDFLMYLYGASDIVLANSTYEPFGIVGLEVMAKGGLPVVGNTGEDYALHNKNALRVKSDDPLELADMISDVFMNPLLTKNIKSSGMKTAKVFTWDRALGILVHRIERVLNECNIPRAGVKDSDTGEVLLEKKHY